MLSEPDPGEKGAFDRKQPTPAVRAGRAARRTAHGQRVASDSHGNRLCDVKVFSSQIERDNWVNQGPRSEQVICDGKVENHDTKAILCKAWALYPAAKETRVFHGALCCHDKAKCAVCVSRLAIEKQTRKAAQRRAAELAKERRTEP